MSTRRIPRPAMVAAVVLVVVVALAGSWSRVEAAFSATVINAGNVFGAAGPSGTGALYAFGDTGDTQMVPTRADDTSSWTSVASGDHYTCGIRTGGGLWCWGHGYGAGQLGVGDYNPRLLPTRVGTAAWSQVTAGAAHTCGIQTDGTLWCWGDGAQGKLGQGTTSNANVPKQVTTPAAGGWASVSAGNLFTCATRTDGSLYCFGRNASGEAGIGSTVTPQSTPVQVAGTDWASISLGYQHACGLRTDKSLYCWGDGGSGRLGIGTTANATSPTLVAGSWEQVSLGTDHSCAVKTGGSLWCWGVGGSGRLGTGSTSGSTTPARVGTGSSWVRVSGARVSTCAMQTDTSIWCWGNNTYGQLGLGDTTDRSVPFQVGSDPTWNGISPGPISYQSCATRTAGTLWCWGDTQAVHFTPYPVDAVTTWNSSAANDKYACGTRTDRSLWCWGRNNSGRLGLGDTVDRYTPARVGSASMWLQVTAGAYHACAVGTDTTLWCWGDNGNGQLGIGSTTSATAPAQVQYPATTGWTSVSAGNQFTCATRTDGSMYCFGRNLSGETGKGGATTTREVTPVPVVAPAAGGWATVSLGYQHACALTTDGSLYCWGDGGNGRLGVNSTTTFSSPQKVGSSVWQAVGLGTDHSCAVRDVGSLWCWGAGGSGRLGNGSTGNVTLPAQIGTATSWRSVSGGATHTCGTQAFGTVWCWGGNAYGQLGLGESVTTQMTPARLTGHAGRPVVSGPGASASLLTVSS
ncbi:RCC1 domain-containing protein [Actinoplanes sp. NPDC051494]|uniref:RCC1 domain-containing protein n=1 Tax=Actinoplanes sp. NPDC051494 TaxID=3363907 RepID=UPI0037AB0397